MIKYIITIATELDGHASADAYYVQREEPISPMGAMDIIFAGSPYEITHSNPPQGKYWGNVNGFSFALTIGNLKTRMTKNTFYQTSSRTG